MKSLSISMTAAETRWGWVYLLLQIFLIPGLIVECNQYFSLGLDQAQQNFLFFCVNFVAVILIFHHFLGKTIRHSVKRPLRCLRAAFFGLLAYQASSLFIGMIITWLVPDFVNLNDQGLLNMSRDRFTLMSIGTVFLVPVTEELFYRGLIFRPLHTYSRVTAYAVSTFVFCTIHIVSYLGSYDPLSLFLSFLQYVPAGLCLAWAYENADSLLAPILIHMTVNQIGISVLR